MYGSFARSMGKNIGEKISKNLSGKYSPGMLAMRQKLLENAKQSATDAIKTSSKRVIQKTAEASGDLTGNKIANRTTKVSKNSQQNNSETVTNEPERKYLKYLKKITYIITYYNSIKMEYQKIINLLENTANRCTKSTK